MSKNFIPEHIDPFRHAEQSLALEGMVKAVDMQRLDAGFLPDGQNVAVWLQFGKDEQGIPYLKGRLKARVALQCQRCMEAFSHEIMSEFLLGIVKTLDEADNLPEQYEPLMAKEGNLALRDLIEDEIILNLPVISRHEPQACQVKLPLANLNGEKGKGENPFHVLESLKQ